MTRMSLSTSHHYWVAAAWWILFTHSPADAFTTGLISESATRLRRITAATAPTIRLFAKDDGPASLVGENAQSGGESSSDSSSSTSSAAATVLLDEPLNNDIDEMLDMPWSDIQTWALMDSLPKFTVFIPSTSSTSIGANGGEKYSSKRYAMWRTITREVPELAGYPIPFLRKMHQRTLQQQRQQQRRRQSSDSSGAGEKEETYETPGVLPMVDNFEFTSNGGIIGRAYGLPGIADGTMIETPSLISPERTVPLGYVITCGREGVDGDDNDNEVGFSYELGTIAPPSSSYYSLDGTERSAALAAAARRLVSEGGIVRVGASTVGDAAKKMAVEGSGLLTDNDANQDLVYLGGATAMLLASATAVGMLSHHLTVNVFWV
jgi:hypothetical protein